MKKKFVVFFFLILSFLSYGQTISICGLKSEYTKGETINFTVENIGDSILFLSSFILEKYILADSQWYEQVYDILNIDCDKFSGKEGFVLGINSVNEIKWNPRKIAPTCFSYLENSGKYRLSFKYSTDIKGNAKHYTKEFEILE